jgi:hypothetical protein
MNIQNMQQQLLFAIQNKKHLFCLLEIYVSLFCMSSFAFTHIRYTNTNISIPDCKLSGDDNESISEEDRADRFESDPEDDPVAPDGQLIISCMLALPNLNYFSRFS